MTRLLKILILFVSIALTIEARPRAGFYPRASQFLISAQPVPNANGYMARWWTSTDPTINTVDMGKYPVKKFTIVRTNSTTYFCQVRAWMANADWLPAGGDWLDYPVCQWPLPQPVLDHYLLTGPVGVPVVELPGLEYKLPIGAMTAAGLQVMPDPSTPAMFFALDPDVGSRKSEAGSQIAALRPLSSVIIGPAQPLQITTIFRKTD